MRVLAASLVAAALIAPVPVFAHGGAYRGPAGEVPPDSRNPEDPPPPDSGPNGTPTPPDTGPDGTPTTPPDSGPDGTPTTPPDGTPDKPGVGGPVPPSTGPGPGTGSKRPTAKKGPSFDSWLFWWNYNKDGILGLRRAMRAGEAETRSGGLGPMEDGGAANVGAVEDVTAEAIRRRVVPLLEKYAADGRVHFDIQASAVIGLARIGRRDRLPLFMKLARPGEGDQVHKVVEEFAALAIGILGERTPEAREFLASVAADPAARVRTRCFAAFALGLLGAGDGAPFADPEGLEALRALVLSRTEASPEIAASALVALGHFGDPAALPDLVAWLREERAGGRPLNDLQLSCAAAALGRIGRPGLSGPGSREVVAALREQLLRKNRLTRYSAVIALGRIAPGADEAVQRECVALLSEVVASEGHGGIDQQTVNFALASLGRVAAACPEPIRAPAIARLRRAFESRQASTRSFAALGLGVALMDRPDSVRAPFAEEIRESLARAEGDVESRGALCIAVGLLRDIRSAGALAEIVRSGGDGRLRGAAVLGLGLVRDPSSTALVREALLEKKERELRVDAAVASGLLRDGRAVDHLVAILADPKSSQFGLGTAASALGRIGDRRAVEPLAAILEGKDYPPLTRALACVALGQIGDRGDVPVLSRMSEDVNYRAYFDAIGELLTIL